MAGKNINLYLMDGIPEGWIKCTLSNWTGVAYKIPRTELDKCKDRADLSQSGIYFLFGVEEEGAKAVVYVGQADVRKNGNGLLGRLQEHRRNADKDYWTEAIVFTTSNNFLGATEISWLESHFCSFAKKANRYIVKMAMNPLLVSQRRKRLAILKRLLTMPKLLWVCLDIRFLNLKFQLLLTRLKKAAARKFFIVSATI